MKKSFTLLLAVLMITAVLAGCAKEAATDATEAPAADEKIELTVFAAASMSEALTEIAEKYKKAAPEVEITFNFDSSGTLKTQIEEGADCDIFLSAAEKQMDELDIESENNPDGLDFIEHSTRFDILENKVALCVPEGNPKGIDSFDDLKTALEGGDILFAMGNEDVPVGQYTQKIFEYYGLDEAALADAGVITYGSNVKEVTSQISEGSVDAGIIYQTDAKSAELTIVDTATEEMCGRVTYPIAVLKNSKNADAACAFIYYLTSSDAYDSYEKVGFTPLK